jgi:hypothetical protein
LHGMAHWKATIHIYHHKKVSKIPKIVYIHNRLPKNAKSHFGRLGPLGVNNTYSLRPKLLDCFYWNININPYRTKAIFLKKTPQIRYF